MEQEQLKSLIESLLFVSNKALTVKDFCKLLEAEPEPVRQALDSLIQERRDAGVVILENDCEYQMATQPQNSTVVKNFLNAELREKLTDATVEVLAIIAYRQPISKAEIEAIRGVNSQYSIRHLLMRGMIEKVPNPHDARGFLYQTTTEFLMHLGIGSVKDLPEFEKLVEQIKLPETPAVAEAMADKPAPTEAATNEPASQEAPVAAQAAASEPATEAAMPAPGTQPEPPPIENQQPTSLPSETIPTQTPAELVPVETTPEFPATKTANVPAEIPAESAEEDEEDEFDDEDDEDEEDEEEK